MTDCYYIVMCRLRSGTDPGYAVEYTGKRWDFSQELEAQEELWDAQHDGDVEEAYIKEVCPW